MFIAILKYTKLLAEVDALVAEHRHYLQGFFDKKRLLVAGRLHSQTGGVIVSTEISREEFEEILKNDPFRAVSEHTVLELKPSLMNYNWRSHV